MVRFCVICNEQYMHEIHTVGVIHSQNVAALKSMLECVDDIIDASMKWPTRRLLDFKISLELFVNPRNSYFSKVYAFLMLNHIDKLIRDRAESKEWIRNNILVKDVAELVVSYMD